MRLKLIACEVLYRELCAAAARSPNQVDVEFLSKGLHDQGHAAMCAALQAAVDRVSPDSFDAIAMGYGLCGNGAAGLVTRSLPLVVPRAHDCIALLMGGRDRYQTYFESTRGVYYRSTGWLERAENVDQTSLAAARTSPGAGYTVDELISRYGEENGRYLFGEFASYQSHYRQLTYIATGVEPDGRFEQKAREEAAERGWRFEKIAGSLRIFEKLVAGDWSEDEFLVVPPGWRVKAVYDHRIVDKEPAE